MMISNGDDDDPRKMQIGIFSGGIFFSPSNMLILMTTMIAMIMIMMVMTVTTTMIITVHAENSAVDNGH